MNWFKRNWIDVLMVTLILAGVGGFLTLLLRGAGLLPNAATSTPTQTAASTTPPAAPSDTPGTVATSNTMSTNAPSPAPTATPDVTTPDVNVAVSVPPAPTPPTPVAPNPSTKPAATKPTSTKPATTTTKPQQDIRIEIKPAAKPAPKPTPKPAAQISKPTQTIATKPTVAKPTTTTPKPAPSATTNPFNAKRSDFLKNHRVAVGTYGNLARAQGVAGTLRAQGLPAQAFQTGNNAVVVIGPYRYEKSARRILERVSGNYPGAILYRPNGTRVAATTRKTTPNNAATTRQTSQPSPAVQAAPKIPTGPAYLQVGAFKSNESINALRDQLASAGYAITLRSRPDGLVRLLVGPMSGQTLGNAIQDLRARGLNPIVVAQ